MAASGAATNALGYLGTSEVVSGLLGPVLGAPLTRRCVSALTDHLARTHMQPEAVATVRRSRLAAHSVPPVTLSAAASPSAGAGRFCYAVKVSEQLVVGP